MVRLKKNADFQIVYRKGRSKADRYLVLYRLNRHSGDSRIGVSVSKKVGNSVVRHKIKRRLKEIYRLRENKFEAGFDLVVIARKPAAEADFRTLEKSMTGLLEASLPARKEKC